ncbi:hypothetical protein FQA39_LY10536 [Lamprigera yunnana]|nr:hypothetical protein FQA39_LY10536 [Lamprigera yunnana]
MKQPEHSHPSYEVKSVDKSGPSIAQKEAVEEILSKDIQILSLKNAITYYEQLLAQDGVIAEECLVEKKFLTDKELIMNHEIDDDNTFKEFEQKEDKSDYEPQEKKLRSLDFIPID